MQSLFIGMGAVMGSCLPWVLTHVFAVPPAAGGGSAIPDSVRYAFYIGAVVYFLAVMWTVWTTKEYPPHDLEAFRRERAEGAGFGKQAAEMVAIFKSMPQTMRQLAWVQFFTWFGLFCMWLYFSVAVARNIFGATDEKSALFTQGVEWAGLCSSFYNAVALVFAIALLALAKRHSPRAIHTVCLALGGIGLASVGLVENKNVLFVCMAGVGVAWASIVSMPYAMLSGCLPENKIGVYMGIFNLFIVIPQIFASLGLGWVMEHYLNNNRMAAIVIGGIALMAAAGLTLRVKPHAAAPA